MKRVIPLLAGILIASLSFAAGQKEAAAAFPTKPIHLIIYTAPGGLIDITARKFIDIAAKYTKATFVAENKAGAGGIVAQEYVLAQPADGYTLFAVTRSNIANLVSQDSPLDPFALDWVAFLISDPECLITSKNNKVKSWADIVEDAKVRAGQQIWIAPPGVDEYVTYKVWDKAGLSGKYVPYDSGAKAIAAVLGGQGEVYVGNPADIAGKPDLMIAALAAEKRLPQFPDVPTFKELGVSGLNEESMWRGFALKKGVPEAVQKWYDELFEKVTQDADWRQFYEKNGMEVVYQRRDRFNQIIKDDIVDLKKFLKK